MNATGIATKQIVNSPNPVYIISFPSGYQSIRSIVTRAIFLKAERKLFFFFLFVVSNFSF
jgi:hypothetical protein